MNKNLLPDYIILDIGIAFQEFLNIFLNFPSILESKPDREEFPIEAVSSILEYIADLNTAEGSLAEYAFESAEMYSEILNEQECDLLRNALNALGIAVFQQLLQLDAYDEQGALWYKFDRFVGHTIRISKMTPEEISDFH